MQNLSIYKRRLDQFISRVHDRRYGERSPLTASYIYHADTPIPYEEAVRRSDYEAIEVGQTWGRLWGCAWFRFSGRIPEALAGKPVVALLDVEGEACVFQDGVPVRGLTTRNAMRVNEAKRRVPISEAAAPGESVDLLVEAGANTLFGERGEDHDYELRQAELAVYDEEAWQLWLDLSFLRDLAGNLPVTSTRAKQLYRGLNDAANAWQEGRGLSACREVTRKLLAVGASQSAATVWSVGHAHIDLGWLWPIRETRRKGGRTFSTALRLMERYPDYVFGASQPQLYRWVKQDYPALYDQIRRRVAEGRWECQGAMWVEPDMNLAGGEALVRQCLYGRAFFREEFGVEVDNLWLPDVFGYSAALPQILKKCNVDYFVTQKISWNEMNDFPHHTFFWEGIDGTRILSHFLPTNNYNVVNSPSQLIAAENRFAQGDVQPHFLNLYGVGDGGGGPSQTHIEYGMRASDTEGMPRFRFATSAEFLRRISQIEEERLPKWVGELYLELHRGTYTTQALMKRYNRQLELLLRDVEFLSVLGGTYPKDQLLEIWRETLLNQFHDILPGSSIGWVYREAHEASKKNLARLAELAEAALESLHGPKASTPEYLVVYNTLSWARREPFRVPKTLVGNRNVVFADSSGAEVPCAEIDGEYVVTADLAPMGYTTLRVKGATAEGGATSVDENPRLAGNPPAHGATTVSVTDSTLENRFVRVRLGAGGAIESIYDKELDREMLAEPANDLMLWEDHPYSWDAWDVSHYYRETAPEHARLSARTVAVSSPGFGALRQALEIGSSTVEQVVSLSAESRMIRVDNTVDWRESHKFLKARAAAAVHGHEATFEIQYGQVKRPNHENTSWDQAKFEVAAHRYADLSQSDFGLAVLNDCKYGHRIIGNEIELSLLRSPKSPDPEADMHVHTFTFAYLPHRGDVNAGEVLVAAHELNASPIVYPVSTAPESPSVSFFGVEGGAVKIEAVKRAEAGDATIVRLYEYAGTAARVHFTAAVSQSRAAETDLEEREIRDVAISASGIELSFGPYEIKTVKLTE